MKVLESELERLEPTEWMRQQEPVDLTRCTRCGSQWNFDLIERIEIWTCDRCGYEARERSSDFRRILIAQHEALIG